MKNITYLNELLETDSSLTLEKPNVTIYFFLIFAGVVIAIIGTQTTSNQTTNYILGLCGFLITIIAIGSLLSISTPIINTSTHERLFKYKLYFNSNQEELIKENLDSCNLQALLDNSQEFGTLMLIIYTTPSHNHLIYQLFTLTSHEYTPYSPPTIHNTP